MPSSILLANSSLLACFYERSNGRKPVYDYDCYDYIHGGKGGEEERKRGREEERKRGREEEGGLMLGMMLWVKGRVIKYRDLRFGWGGFDARFFFWEGGI